MCAYVCVHMSVCMWVHMGVRICVLCVCAHEHVRMCVHVNMCMYVCICVCTWVWVCMCVYVCMCVCAVLEDSM